MQEILQTLKAHGCDIDGAMNRMLNDESFLLRCMRASLDQPEFEQLGQALAQRNAREAFENAHALKGVLGNVGLTPLFECVIGIVEPTRAGRTDGLDDQYAQLLALREEMRRILA